MLELILELPAQLRWAADLEPPALDAAETALVTGMGGSGISGDVAAVVAGEARKLVLVHKGYGLPGWAAVVRPLVVAVSHSGDTEETLSAVGETVESELPLAVVTTGGRLAELAADADWPLVRLPGGPQPRAALGYLAGGVLRTLEAAGLLPPQSEALREAADVVDGLLGGGEGSGMRLGADIAEALDGRVTVIYGGLGVGATAAGRWKTQINENGKAPAYWSALPELDHNEVVGWDAVADLTGRAVGVVFLRDGRDHPRVAQRVEFTQELMDGKVGIAGQVWAQGEGLLARLFSLMVIGDIVSVTIAERAGVDPMPVDVIERLKQRLVEERP
ncbi:MAG: bifunctional phosphoglucose/phosphomannose isomerase [Acidimicrobiia bacterium]